MVVFWQGRGWAVLPIMFAWMFGLIVVFIATDGPEGNPNAEAFTYRLMAVSFVLSAATVYYMTWRRAIQVRDAAEPEVVPSDSFMFLPMKYYVYLFAAGAAYLLVRSFTG